MSGIRRTLAKVSYTRQITHRTALPTTKRTPAVTRILDQSRLSCKGTLGEEAHTNKVDTYDVLLSIHPWDIINDNFEASIAVP